MEGQVVALLVQNMERLDEQVKEEADGIYNTLGEAIYIKILTKTLYTYNNILVGLVIPYFIPVNSFVQFG